MEKGDDPYEILGVEYTATEDEIKKEYRKMALKYHPDRHQSEEDKEKFHDVFAKISAAYDCLTDPVKRYDWKLANERKMNGSVHSGATASTTKTRTKPQTKPQPQPQPRAYPQQNNPNQHQHQQNQQQNHQQNQRRNPQAAAAQEQFKSPPTSQKQHAPAPPASGFARFRRSPKKGTDANTVQSSKSSRRSMASSTSASTSTYSGKPKRPKEDMRRPPPQPTTWSRTPTSKPASRPTPNTAYNNSTTTNNNNNKAAAVGRKPSPYAGKPATKNAKEDPRAPRTSYTGTGTGQKEDPHKPESSYSLSGLNGKPVDVMYNSHRQPSSQPPSSQPPQKHPATAPQSRKKVVKKPMSSFGLLKTPDLDHSNHSGNSGTSSRSGRSGRSGRSAPTRPQSQRPKSFTAGSRSHSHSPKPGPRKKVATTAFTTAATNNNNGNGNAQDPQQHMKSSRLRGGKKKVKHTGYSNNEHHVNDGVSSSNSNSNNNKNNKNGGGSTKKCTKLHNPYEPFERILKEQFEEDYWERDWKKKKSIMSMSILSGGGSKKTIHAKSQFNPRDLNTVISMTTCTKKEKRSDGLLDIKTVTKILRVDGSVEKIVQASVGDKEQAKAIDSDTITITREKEISKLEK